MATPNSSVAVRAPASSRPQAHPGYGKHSAPDQRPPRQDDFLLLPERERYIAGYVDRLPEGGAMDIKSLAKHLPLYGQMAVGTALRALAVAGHLRRVRCRIEVDNQNRWVTRTFWSRTARDNEWWATRLAAESAPASREAASAPTTPPPPWAVTEPLAAQVAVEVAAEVAVAPLEPAPHPAPPAPAVPQQRTPEPSPDGPSPAYLALARLGRVDPRLPLSAADCAALEDRASEWLARGVSTDYLTHALASGLPDRVDSPVGFVRGRLKDKIPPHLPAAPAAPAPGAPGRRLLVECTECGAPGPAEALPDGLCRPCREAPHEAAPTTEPAIERNIQAHMKALRDGLRLP
ncbi:MarR family transcriptional regulator [Streptomyces sp. NPDC005790]|uniref:MarR family transcriptional regulator n=1 Tax=Streptomyces sp. NPDC005790 TaxID=3154777 RepID=UPI0034022BA6